MSRLIKSLENEIFIRGYYFAHAPAYDECGSSEDNLNTDMQIPTVKE